MCVWGLRPLFYYARSHIYIHSEWQIRDSKHNGGARWCSPQSIKVAIQCTGFYGHHVQWETRLHFSMWTAKAVGDALLSAWNLSAWPRGFSYPTRLPQLPELEWSIIGDRDIIMISWWMWRACLVTISSASTFKRGRDTTGKEPQTHLNRGCTIAGSVWC